MCDRATDGGTFSMAGQGRKLEAGETLGINRSAQYTPLLVTMMIEMHVSDERRKQYLEQPHLQPPARREVIELLRRAEIVVQSPEGLTVNEEALRIYVNALCSVSLPTKLWVMR